MRQDRWAIGLVVRDEERLEDRVATIIRYLMEQREVREWIIFDLDATGDIGGRLTRLLNAEKRLLLPAPQLLDALSEEGQIIELRATAAKEGEDLFELIIRDGRSVDVLGTADRIPSSILGDYYEQDIGNFRW